MLHPENGLRGDVEAGVRVCERVQRTRDSTNRTAVQQGLWCAVMLECLWCAYQRNLAQPRGDAWTMDRTEHDGRERNASAAAVARARQPRIPWYGNAAGSLSPNQSQAGALIVLLLCYSVVQIGLFPVHRSLLGSAPRAHLTIIGGEQRTQTIQNISGFH